MNVIGCINLLFTYIKQKLIETEVFIHSMFNDDKNDISGAKNN